jgi:hypothetical protein
MSNLLPAFLLSFSLCVAGMARTEFSIGPEVPGGQLSWCGHTVAPCLDAPVPPDDHIVEDSAAKTLSLGLHWQTTPDAATGECLAATYYWRIAQAKLVVPRYRIAVERSGPAEIVFVLTPESGGAAVLRSPRCPLAKAFFGTLEDVAKHTTRIDAQALLKDVEKRAPAPAQIDFGPAGWPQVWTSLHDEFAREVRGCHPWLDAPATGLEPKFVFRSGKLQEEFGDFGLPRADVVVPLDDEARAQFLALLRDDTPVKNQAKEWADGGCATLSLAMEFFTVTVVFEKQEYRYTIDPVFGLVDVSIGGRPELYTENMPLTEKFVQLCSRQMHDERVKVAMTEARRRTYAHEKK